MKQILFLFSILLLSLTSANAQLDSAKDVIDNVRAYYQSNDSFVADVTFEIDVPESTPEVMSGKMYLKKDKFKFVLANQEIISDNVNLWQWTKDKSINEVQVSYVEDDQNIITPSRVFNDFLKGVTYKLITTSKRNGKDISLIEIIPVKRNDTDEIFKIKVVVNTNESNLQQMQIFTKDGYVYTFTIANEKITAINDSEFTFRPESHKGVEVIDLR